jgi:regulator of replication initiation timing
MYLSQNIELFLSCIKNSIISVSEANTSELEVLRQRIVKLEEVWRRCVTLQEEKFAKLKAENASLVVENFNLKIEIAKLRKELGAESRNWRRVERIPIPKMLNVMLRTLNSSLKSRNMSPDLRR